MEVCLFPNFNHSGVIPPFLTSPTQRDGSPYQTDLVTIVSQLGQTPERRTLIAGLLDYRDSLRAIGITSGFQLIDGSFTEDCESINGRSPGDIDLVTYAYLPVAPTQVSMFLQNNLALFHPTLAKQNYHCEAFFIDMAKNAELLVDDTLYWNGLFSHQRSTFMWKGMLRVPLMADDTAARAQLAALAGAGNGP
jgi:hypothetical protein